MKKVVLCLLVAVAVTGVVCADGVENFGKKISTAKKAYDDASAVGELGGVIVGYATNSDSVDEFIENMADHEYNSETLQWAQETGAAIGDAIADVYIDLTSDDEEE